MKNNLIWEGFVAGAVAGLVGAVLVTEFAWSLFGVGVVGAIVGVLVAFIFQKFKR